MLSAISAVRQGAPTIQEIKPLEDPRWSKFVTQHPSGSVFHTSRWLEALHRTYGYVPLALTTSVDDAELHNAVVYCDVRSRLTGRRFVSLPFSDHCEPLIENTEQSSVLLSELERRAQAERCKYVELRPTSSRHGMPSTFQITQKYVYHRLDLRPGSRVLFNNFHHDCIKRKISRAEREGIEVRKGTSMEAQVTFHRLVTQTRRRQGLPPQPLAWFRNIAECLGDSAILRLAYKDSQPIAGVLTLQQRKTLYYKYAASDARFHNQGGVQYLVWSAIQDGVKDGFEEFDMGRSDMADRGLVTFKDRWGAERSELFYWTSLGIGIDALSLNCKRGVVRRVLALLPDAVLRGVGSVFYPHIG